MFIKVINLNGYGMIRVNRRLQHELAEYLAKIDYYDLDMTRRMVACVNKHFAVLNLARVYQLESKHIVDHARKLSHVDFETVRDEDLLKDLSVMFENLGDFYQFYVVNDYEAISMYIRAMEASHKIHEDSDCVDYARLFSKTGDVFFCLKEFELALKQYSRALKMRQDIYAK